MNEKKIVFIISVILVSFGYLIASQVNTASSAVCGQKSTFSSGAASGFSCTGSRGIQQMNDGYYESSSFGCSARFGKDPNDNCLPACQTIPECSGVSAGNCEQTIKWYIADADRFGCNAKLLITNPQNGKAVVVEAIDKGPACSVENRYSRGVIDMSQDAAYELFGSNLINQSITQVTVVPASTPLGPVGLCSSTSTPTPTTPTTVSITPCPNTSVNACANVFLNSQCGEGSNGDGYFCGGNCGVTAGNNDNNVLYHCKYNQQVASGVACSPHCLTCIGAQNADVCGSSKNSCSTNGLSSTVADSSKKIDCSQVLATPGVGQQMSSFDPKLAQYCLELYSQTPTATPPPCTTPTPSTSSGSPTPSTTVSPTLTITPTPSIVSGTCGSVLDWDNKLNAALQVGSSGLYSRMMANINSNCNYTAHQESGANASTTYWCTFSIIDSYNLAGLKGLTAASHLSVIDMANWWQTAAGYTYVDFHSSNHRDAIKKVHPGYAIFYESVYGVWNGHEHVAMVSSISVDANGNGKVTTIDSNSTSKSHTYPIVNGNVLNTHYPVIGFGGH